MTSLAHYLKMLIGWARSLPHVFPHIPTMQYMEFETGENSAIFKQYTAVLNKEFNWLYFSNSHIFQQGKSATYLLFCIYCPPVRFPMFVCLLQLSSPSNVLPQISSNIGLRGTGLKRIPVDTSFLKQSLCGKRARDAASSHCRIKAQQIFCVRFSNF